MIGLALDGPLNGEYIGVNVTPEDAEAAGYVLGEWPNGETVWYHLDQIDVEVLPE